MSAIARCLLLSAACTLAVWAGPAVAGDGDEARVIVEVESLPPPGGAPGLYQTRVQVTGTGFPPRRAAGTAQGRLMARRAAVVDGYRKIATATDRWRAASGGGDRYRGRETAYVRGASVEHERYFTDGRVEVEMSAPPPESVPAPDTPEAWQRFQETAARAGMRVVTEPAVGAARREISREEWEQLFVTRQSDARASSRREAEEPSEPDEE